MVKKNYTSSLTVFIFVSGDFLDISNPDGDFEKERLDKCSHLVMYAAGTGFTPMAGLILQAAELDPNPSRSVQSEVNT